MRYIIFDSYNDVSSFLVTFSHVGMWRGFG